MNNKNKREQVIMKNKKTIIKTAITTTLALSVSGSAFAIKTPEERAKDVAKFTKNGLVQCAGRVKAGLNDCPTSQHACAGMADEDGDYEEFIWLPLGTCNKIVGAHMRPLKKKIKEKTANGSNQSADDIILEISGKKKPS